MIFQDKVRGRTRLWDATFTAAAATALSWASIALAHPAPEIGGARNIQVVEAWIEPFPDSLGIAYATLTNTSDKPVELRSASATVGAYTEMDRSDAPHRMTPVKNIDIKARSTLSFKSNHLHLTLHQVSLDGEKQISVTLLFSDGSSMTVPFEVREKAAR